MTVGIIWFRKSLRIHDNRVLSWAYESDEIKTLFPIYIFEEGLEHGSTVKMGESRLRFQYECVADLDHNLNSKLGISLNVFSGDYLAVFDSIREQLQDQSVCLLSEYCSDFDFREQYKMIEKKFIASNPNWSSKSFPAEHTILDIEAIVNSPGYKTPNSMKDMIQIFSQEFGESDNIIFATNDLPNFDLHCKQIFAVKSPYLTTFERIQANLVAPSYFIGGESEALSRLNSKVIAEASYVRNFNKPRSISTNLDGRPMEPSTTGLSPYLSTGCLSVRRLWNACSEIQRSSDYTKPPVSLQGQLMFREMFYLLSRTVENWDKDIGNTHCKNIRWADPNHSLLDAWSSGQTGFPLIDAMMRQLNSTGWMHHLGRHAVSCFLTRGQLWQNWMYGRDVFERKLIDSDWAINNGNWLWLAGVAPFSMPYYRIYNPCPDSKSSLNVETENADFIRYWIPELSTFPSKYIFEPHLAPLSVQESAACIIGRDYPDPIVDRKVSRKQNLERFKLNL